MSIANGISAVRHGSELLRALREAMTNPEVNHLEVANRLIEIQGLLLDAHSALIDAQTERQSLEGEIKELKRVADFGKDFEFAEGVYWRQKYPYCPNCWDAEGKPIRLAGPYFSGTDARSAWKCPLHQTTYYLNRMVIS